MLQAVYPFLHLFQLLNYSYMNTTCFCENSQFVLRTVYVWGQFIRLWETSVFVWEQSVFVWEQSVCLWEQCMRVRTVCMHVRTVCMSVRTVCMRVRTVCMPVWTVCMSVRTVCMPVWTVCTFVGSVRACISLLLLHFTFISVPLSLQIIFYIVRTTSQTFWVSSESKSCKLIDHIHVLWHFLLISIRHNIVKQL